MTRPSAGLRPTEGRSTQPQHDDEREVESSWVPRRPGDTALEAHVHHDSGPIRRQRRPRLVGHARRWPSRRRLSCACLARPWPRPSLERAHVLGLQIEVDDRLAERMNWDGETDFDTFVREWRQATADRDDVPMVGDSSRAAGARLLEALSQRCRGGTASLIAVAHGGVTVDLLPTILGDATVEASWPTLLDDGVPAVRSRS